MAVVRVRRFLGEEEGVGNNRIRGVGGGRTVEVADKSLGVGEAEDGGELVGRPRVIPRVTSGGGVSTSDDSLDPGGESLQDARQCESL